MYKLVRKNKITINYNYIKIVRRFARGQYPEGEEPEVYDIYFDVCLAYL